MDLAELIERLRRLRHARPGDGVLHLPPDCSPSDALQTIRAALKCLEPASSVRPDPPGGGVARIHIDGAARGNPGPAGIGVLIIGPDGAVKERLYRGLGKATNNVAEYRALLLGLERAQALGYSDIQVFSDSELLVRQIQGRYQVKNAALKELFAAAKARLAGFRGFRIQHVPREQNAEADALANRGIDAASRPGRSTENPEDSVLPETDA